MNRNSKLVSLLNLDVFNLYVHYSIRIINVGQYIGLYYNTTDHRPYAAQTPPLIRGTTPTIAYVQVILPLTIRKGTIYIFPRRKLKN